MHVARAEIVDTAMEHDGKKEFVVYVVMCATNDGHSWQCCKRFSEFVQLTAALQSVDCSSLISKPSVGWCGDPPDS